MLQLKKTQERTVSLVKTKGKSPKKAKKEKKKVKSPKALKIRIQEKYKNASIPDVMVQQGQTSQCITEIDDGQQVMKMHVDADDSFCQSDFDSSQLHEQQSNSESDLPTTSDDESDSEEDEYSDSPWDLEQEQSTSTRQDGESAR